jgi:LacI family transcriptional regulator
VRLLLEMVQERTKQLSPRKIVLQPVLLTRESSRWRKETAK